MDRGQPILLDRTAVRSPFQTQKTLLPAHSLGLSLTLMKGTVAGSSVVISAKGLIPSALGPDPPTRSRSDPQLPQAWASETAARADEFPFWVLSLATARPSFGVLPPSHTPTGSGLPIPPCGSVLTAARKPWTAPCGPPITQNNTCLPVGCGPVSFLPVVLVIFLQFPHKAPDG